MNPILEKRLFTVIKNRPVATGIFELTLQPAEGTEMFRFIAGQWVYLYLLNEDGSEWARAAFSIASAPSESTTQLELTIKVYGDYTKRAQQLASGERVRLQGPFGVFTVKPGAAPIVLCAGGIGLTPFRSMIRELAAQHDPRSVTLFYSNPTREAAAYVEELKQLTMTHSQLHVVFLFTREIVPESEQRRLDATTLTTHVANPSVADYFMCGPEPFMDAIKEALMALKIDPKTHLHKELFN